MAFQRTDGIGGQAIAEVSTTQNHPFGTRVKAYSTTYGHGEFVYVKGVADGAVGAVCTYSPLSGVTVLTIARSKGLVGVMMSVLDATTDFGWIQVAGTAVAAVADTVVAGETVYTTATPGSVDDAAVTGDIVYRANFATDDANPAAGFALVSISNPWCGDTDNSAV